MRYMYLIHSPEASGRPPQRLIEEMGKLAEKAGPAMIESGGLMPTAMGARIRLAKGKLTVTDGPFAETKEVIGGYAVFEFASREEALKSALDFMDLHRLFGEGWEGVCEMRPIAPMGPAHC